MIQDFDPGGVPGAATVSEQGTPLATVIVGSLLGMVAYGVGRMAARELMRDEGSERSR